MGLNIENLSTEEKAQLLQELTKAEADKKRKVKEEREALKVLTDETINSAFDVVMPIAEQLSEGKRSIHEMFNDIIEMKSSIYNNKSEQLSHTFTSQDGKRRLILGYHVVDDYDDTLNMGIEKVKNYLSSLAKDENSSKLVKAVLKLLSKDQKGNLKASRVIQLDIMAKESGDNEFIDGVEIIKKAYKPVKSKQYIIASVKNEETNAWENVPLGMTEAKF